MKKLSSLMLLMGFMLFTISLQAQTSGCTKAEKEACEKICSASAATSFFSIFASNPTTTSCQKVNTSPKASCAAVSKTAVTVKTTDCNPANCIPENCPPGCKPSNCLPANCKLRSESKTAVAVNLNE